MLEKEAKRHMSKKNISLDQCLSDEILDCEATFVPLLPVLQGDYA
jgi:hypothetical protein